MPKRRMARACVINKTGYTLRTVKVIHKYSNEYKNEMEWKNVANGSETTGFDVEYNTGPFTTGKDWWYIAWQNSDTAYMTNPQNFREIFDISDKLLGRADVTGILFNPESTANFKQHILRAEDEGRVTRIVLYSNNRVTIESRSGTSETQYRMVRLRAH